MSNALFTAAVPASAIAAPGPDAVAVVNPAPGGGASAMLNFAVPSVIPSSAPASGQTSVRLGAYYFDGWSGPLSNFRFQGLPLGPYRDRQPFSTWQDNSISAVEQQLATAHNFGIDFFIFDWYFNVAVNDPGAPGNNWTTGVSSSKVDRKSVFDGDFAGEINASRTSRTVVVGPET